MHAELPETPTQGIMAVIIAASLLIVPTKQGRFRRLQFLMLLLLQTSSRT